VDEYAQKLFNFGFKLDQTRTILVGGLTGYERKLSLSKDRKNPKWKPPHQQPASISKPEGGPNCYTNQTGLRRARGMEITKV
jgi:hypothetical protein